MNPRYPHVREGARPQCTRLARVLTVAFALLLTTFWCASAEAQRRRKKKRRPAAAKDAVGTVKERKQKGGGKEQVFDFTGLQLEGSVRTPQLLYFLDRAAEELHRASLKRRSFVPEMVRSIDEEGL